MLASIANRFPLKSCGECVTLSPNKDSQDLKHLQLLLRKRLRRLFG
jgi:hypothetical protein